MRARRGQWVVAAADEKGSYWEEPAWLASARIGCTYRPPRDEELIELPPHARVMYLPGRVAVGWFQGGGTRGVPDPVDGAMALACILPSGYTRTLLPAYECDPDAPDLPLFGYAAVAFKGDKLYCAAVRTDSNPRWNPAEYHRRDLDGRIRRMQERYPHNRVLRQLVVCAREYGCYNAQNVFYGRWEGAVPVSPACNATCRGCISWQPEDMPASPQQRFDFVPTQEEIVEVGLEHLRHPEAIYSFGQGCEGEPLLRAELIARSIRAMRAETDRGCIHLNTNASRPAGLRAVVEAGLDSIRVSLNSVLAPNYTEYYQPRNYTFEDVVECIRISRAAGLQVCLNYLVMPGWNDAEEEVESLLDLLEEFRVDMVQMRNLNIDPDLYARYVEQPRGKILGIPEMLRRLRRELPDLRIGNHTPFFQRARA